MRRVSVFVIVVIVAAVMLPLAAGTGAAQGFATNTPPPPTRTPLALATNTPPPPITTPAAPLGRYALRAWSEADLVTALTAFVGRLRPGDSDGQRIVTLLQHELRRRFPAAPRDPEARRALLHALLAAPPASVDVRAIARPHIAALLAQHDARPGAAFSADGFMIEVLPAALTGPDANDALVHVRYPDDPLAPARYVDYLLARAGADGRLTLLESDPPLPAAPLDSITDLMLLGVNDYNHDGVDEVMLSAVSRAILTGGCMPTAHAAARLSAWWNRGARSSTARCRVPPQDPASGWMNTGSNRNCGTA